MPSRWQDLDGIRVGVPTTHFLDHLTPPVRTALDRTRQAVTAAGGELLDVDIPAMRYAPGMQVQTLSTEAFDVNRELLARRGKLLADDVRLRLESGMFLLAGEYARAQRLRGLLQLQVDTALEQVDVLLCPTLPMTAPDATATQVEVEARTWPVQAAMTRLTAPFNLTGHPALSLPWGSDERGLPVGMQLVGGPMDEAAVLGVGHVLEQARAARG
jgi:aspartyl-tRNA(Asn)/glutamyl-tRNA(Gln) amidotransferase subunit A